MSGSSTRTRLAPSRLRRLGEWRCRALADSPMWSLLERGQWPPDLGNSERVATLKRNPRNHSGLLHLPDGPTFYFKRFPHHGIRAYLPGTIRSRRARTNWQLSRHLERHGVGVARAEALLESAGEDWFVAKALPTRRSLARLAKNNKLPPADSLRIALADTLADLHKARVMHGDLKWGNILMDADDRLRLIDLDSARFTRTLDQERADEDLARCLVSALELGLDTDWAREVVRGYSARRNTSEDQLLSRLRPLVERISRRHKTRYGRASIGL